MAFLLADLGVTKTHSRPYVSNDNPYSESQFRTMKYRPEFPDRFGCIQDSRAFCQAIFPLVQRRTSSLRYRHDDASHGPLRPGRAQSAKTANWFSMPPIAPIPNASSARPPKPLPLPKEVWINKPLNSDENTH